jgi:hypothetical protein
MAEGVKKGFCRFQVGRLAPFVEPVVDGIQKRRRIGGTALAAQQPGEARGGAQADQEGQYRADSGAPLAWAWPVR